MRKTLYAKEGFEFTNRRTVAQQQPNLASRFEMKQEHHDPSEGEARKWINNLKRMSGVGDMGEQRGKNHQRNGGECPSEHGSTRVVLAAHFLAG